MEESMFIARSKLTEDMRRVMDDIEQLLRLTADQTGDQIVQLRARAQEHLSTIRQRLAQLQAAGIEKAKAASATTDEYVRAHPWQAVGVAAALSLIVGMLAARR